jgi:hypothetical protein
LKSQRKFQKVKRENRKKKESISDKPPHCHRHTPPHHDKDIVTIPTTQQKKIFSHRSKSLPFLKYILYLLKY